MQEISQLILAAAVQVVGGDLAEQIQIKLTRPEAKFGDLATNLALEIFGLGKKSLDARAKFAGLGVKNPRDLAAKIAEALKNNSAEKLNADAENFDSNNLFTKIEVAGAGFLNLTLNPAKLNQILESEFAAAKKSGKIFGDNNDGADAETGQARIAVVEYPSPNMAKPYSVGHLRSGNQGWAAKNLLQASGWRVITDNHLGDYGAPFGIWCAGFLKFSSEKKLAAGGIYELGNVYIRTRAELKNEAERGEHNLADEVQSWLLKLENGDAEAVKFSEKFSQISLDHIHKVMARLGISTEHEMGEKFFAPIGKAEAIKLLDQKIAVQNPDGSVIIPLDEFGIKTPLLVQKSNGAALYATTDLATLLWRERNWRPDLTVYCVGSEQKFYFEQLDALAKKLNLHQKIYHLWFGTIDQMIDGKREKMSSRKGVVLMEELLDEAEKAARANARRDDLTDGDIRKIAVGAIKFSDFAADRRTGLLFDWQRMFSLTGFSGPYVQYAAVRVNKILHDNAEFLAKTVPSGSNFGERFFLLEQCSAKPSDDGRDKRSPELEAGWHGQTTQKQPGTFDSDNSYDFSAEKILLLKLLEFPEVVQAAARNLEPHRVANYVYQLAKILNKYYETTPVATANVAPNVKFQRLKILEKVAAVFARALEILGIQIPAKM
ncbi:MAG: arginine--tRNA ligase [Candidatus Nomurabacteria bacterium]|jgi:arginyl-tRNA synthetase|nr:arginine--tRNA ligase [Candidatus Nomurabacteria bacterium]